MGSRTIEIGIVDPGFTHLPARNFLSDVGDVEIENRGSGTRSWEVRDVRRSIFRDGAGTRSEELTGSSNSSSNSFKGPPAA